MANVAQDVVRNDMEVDSVDEKKKVLEDDTVVTATPPQSKKSDVIERLILCTALFFPLFLATLDTSIILSKTLANISHCRNGASA